MILQVQCRPQAATALFATAAHALAPRGGILRSQDNEVARRVEASAARACPKVSMLRHGSSVSRFMAHAALLA